MLPPLSTAHPHILIQVISLAFFNRFVRYFEHQQGLHGDSTGQGKETNVEANNNRGKRGGQSVINPPRDFNISSRFM